MSSRPHPQASNRSRSATLMLSASNSLIAHTLRSRCQPGRLGGACQVFAHSFPNCSHLRVGSADPRKRLGRLTRLENANTHRPVLRDNVTTTGWCSARSTAGHAGRRRDRAHVAPLGQQPQRSSGSARPSATAIARFEIPAAKPSLSPRNPPESRRPSNETAVSKSDVLVIQLTQVTPTNCGAVSG